MSSLLGNEEFSSDFGGSCSENDEVPDMDGRFMFGKEETKSRFTEYSMSSSVVKRSEQLVTLDDRFEEVSRMLTFANIS